MRGKNAWIGVGTAVALALLATWTAGCKKQTDNYFPLEQGWNWRYTATADIKNARPEHSKSLVANLAPVQEGSETLIPRIYPDGHVYYYVARPGGIELVADRAPDAGAKFAPPDQYVLKYPLELGNSWTVESMTLLLRRPAIDPRRVGLVPIVGPIDITYTIESRDDVVRVPAGTFRGCLRLKGTGQTRITVERAGDIEATVETTQWFAPGVGLVKVVRREDSSPEGSFAGSLVMELEEVNRGGWLW